MNRCKHVVHIDRFKGEQPVRVMDVYPAKFAENCKDKEECFQRRNSNYFRLLKNAASYSSYSSIISTNFNNPYKKVKQRSTVMTIKG